MHWLLPLPLPCIGFEIVARYASLDTRYMCVFACWLDLAVAGFFLCVAVDLFYS